MTVHDERIPAVIASKLSQTLRRFKRVILLKGLTVTVAVFLGAMLGAIALDRLFLMPDVLRYMLSGAAFLVTLAVAYRYWVRPVLQHPSNVALAATVEEEHPELQERVSSTIEFATVEERAEYRGSQEMIDAVAEQAKTSVGRVDFAEAISAEPARKSTAAAAFLLLVTACIAALWWGEFLQLFHRFAMPWANIGRVSTYRIDVDKPDKLVARGDPVRIQADVTPPNVKETTLYLENEDGRFKPVRMIETRPGTFEHRITAVRDSARYYIRAGDAVTKRYAITAVDRPKVLRIDVHYAYPDYTKMAPQDDLNSPGDIRGVRGTRVTLDVWINRAVDEAYLDMDGPDAPLQRVNDTRYKGTIVLDRSQGYVPFLRADIFTNSADERRQIVVLPDRVPEVTIVKPPRNLKVHSVASQPVTLEVKDDFGVAELAIIYHVNDDKTRHTVPVPLQEIGAPVVLREWRWNLRNIRPRLKPGDMVYYRARARDNRPENPNVGHSSPDVDHEMHSILITSPRSDLDRSVRAEQLRKIRQAMEKLKQELQKAHTQARAMKRQADRKQDMAEWQPRVKEQTKKHLDAAEPKATELAEMLQKDPVMDKLATKAREIEKENIPEAKQAAEKVQENKPLHLSQKPIDKAEAEIRDALRKLDEMSKEMKELEKLEEQERKLAEMADKEDKLADEAGKIEPEQKQNAEDLAKQQDALEKMLEQMMNEAMKQEALMENLEDLENLREDLQNLIDKEKDLKKETAEAMKKKLEELKKRQEDLNKEAKAAKADVQPKLDERKAGEVPERAMEKALDAMEEMKIAEAVKEQQKAEDKMREQAKALEKPAPKQENGAEKPAAPQEAKKMDEMAAKQEEIRRELAQLAGIPQMDKKMQELARRQEELKKDAEALQKQAEPQANKEQPHGEQAPEEMQQALDQMKKMAPENAPKHQEEAAKELDELAENLKKQAENAKPEAAEQADKAEDLAKKQRELKEELEAALPEKNPEMQELADQQEALEQDARALAEEMEEVAGAIEKMLPEAGKQAEKAKGAMEKAPEHMAEAAKELDQADAENAQGEEQNAIDAMEQAHAEAGKLQEQGQHAAEDMQGMPEMGEAAAEMAKALGRMDQASKMMRAHKPGKGQHNMQKAAQALAKAAQQMMQQQQPGMPHASKRPRMGNRTFEKAADLKDLKDLQLTDEEWNRLPGELKAKLLQAMKGKYPEEYRQVIRDYFKRLAETAANGNTGNGR